MIVPMARLRIVGPRSLLGRTTERLQALGVVHLESGPVRGADGLLDRFRADPEDQRRRSEIETVRRALRRLIAALPAVAGSGPWTGAPGTPEEIAANLDRVRPEAEALLGRIREAEEECSLLSKYERVLDSLAPLLPSLRAGKDLEVLGLVLERGDAAAPRALREALGDLTGQRFELVLSRLDPQSMAAILVVPLELAPRVRSFLWQRNISELRFPAAVSDRPLPEALVALGARRGELPRLLDGWRGEMAALSRQARPRLEAGERALADLVDRMESTGSFYQTRSTFVAYGWVPEREVERVLAALAEGGAAGLVAERLGIVRADAAGVPVALENRPAFRSFESLTRLVGLPRYGTIDPTPFLAIGFPIFFGFILGDVGHGALLLVAALAVARGRKLDARLRDLGRVLVPASCSAMGFGVLFGECFGHLGEALGLRPIVADRMHGFLPLLGVALAFGVGHVLLGMGLGIGLAVRHGNRRELAARLCGAAFLLGLLAAGGAFAGVLPGAMLWAGGGVAALAPCALAMFGAECAVRQVHHALNVLSYLRLAGIGIASAALAFAANTLGELTGSLVLGIVVGGLFHAINLAFGVFSPTIQSLRLHYVEFFDTFFEPGGRAYRPFGRR